MHSLTSTSGVTKALIILVITILVVASLSLTYLVTMKPGEAPLTSPTAPLIAPQSSRGYSIVQSYDGGYLIAGDTNYGNDDYLYLVKIDLSGNLLWNKTYGMFDHSYGVSIIKTNDGCYMAACYSTPYAVYLAKIDVSGNMLWNQTYNFGNSLGYSITQTSDGG